VPSRMEGALLGVQLPEGAALDGRRLHLAGSLVQPVVLDVGRATATHDRSSRRERRPTRKLCKLVDVMHPESTGTALRRHRYEVRWSLVTFSKDGNHRATRVSEPPADTVIVSVLDSAGRLADDRRRSLLVELAPKGDPTVASGAEPTGQGLFC
jgi:hypothetical protein